MNVSTWRRHRALNVLQSLLLLTAMAGVLGGLGWVIAGGAGVLWALAGGIVLVALNPGLSPRLVLSAYGARPLAPHLAPELNEMVRVLAERARLPAVPALYLIPSTLINAFAVGSRRTAAVAVSDALLRTLDPREIAGVLAHEISHVRHNDMWVMGLADLFSRLTTTFSTLGQLLLLLNLPLLLFSDYTISWTAIAILILAPTASALMQLALSRTREHDADLGAAELTGDPRGLASALAKMERYQGRFVEQVLLPGSRLPEPSLLRTHPPTQERIERLLALEPGRAPPAAPAQLASLPADRFPVVRRRPRRHFSGNWY